MLARRTCQRVVDKPSLACTALLATVYRSFFNNFLLYIYIYTQPGKRCSSVLQPKAPHRDTVHLRFLSSPQFRAHFSSETRLFQISSSSSNYMHHNISTNCEFFYLFELHLQIYPFVTFLIIEIKIPREKFPFSLPR